MNRLGRDRFEGELLDKADDLIRLFAEIDPSLVVHTVETTGNDLAKYCPDRSIHETECWNLDSAKAEPGLFKKPNVNVIPKHGMAITWTSQIDAVPLGWDALDSGRKPVAANTPGVIVGGSTVAHPDRDKDPVVRFLAMDGSIYFLRISRLALGIPAAGQWPSDVQHSSDELRGKSNSELPPSASPALKAQFAAAYTKLSQCSEGTWKRADPELEANDAANITITTRQNRKNQILERYGVLDEKACRPAFLGVAQVFGKYLDERLAGRQRVYAANRARFLK